MTEVRPRAHYCTMFKTVAAESRDSHAWDMYVAERADIHAFLFWVIALLMALCAIAVVVTTCWG